MSRFSVLDLATMKDEELSKSKRGSMVECPAPATNPSAPSKAPEVKAPALQAKEPVSMLLENPLPEDASCEPHKESKDTLVRQSLKDGFYKTRYSTVSPEAESFFPKFEKTNCAKAVKVNISQALARIE